LPSLWRSASNLRIPGGRIEPDCNCALRCRATGLHYILVLGRARSAAMACSRSKGTCKPANKMFWGSAHNYTRDEARRIAANIAKLPDSWKPDFDFQSAVVQSPLECGHAAIITCLAESNPPRPTRLRRPERRLRRNREPSKKLPHPPQFSEANIIWLRCHAFCDVHHEIGVFSRLKALHAPARFPPPWSVEELDAWALSKAANGPVTFARAT